MLCACLDAVFMSRELVIRTSAVKPTQLCRLHGQQSVTWAQGKDAWDEYGRHIATTISAAMRAVAIPLRSTLTWTTVTDLDGGLGEVEQSGELAAPRSRHVVLLDELALELTDLFSTERRPVASHASSHVVVTRPYIPTHQHTHALN